MNTLRVAVSSLFFSLLCFVVVVAPNKEVLNIFHIYDEKRVWLLLLVLLSSFGLLISHNRSLFNDFCECLSGKVWCTLVLLASCVIISCLNSKFVFMSMLEVGSFLALFIVAVFIADIYVSRQGEFITYMGYALAIASLWYFFSFIFIYFWGLLLAKDEGFSFDFLFHGFMNKRHLNQYQIWALPLITLFVVSARKTKFKSLRGVYSQALNLSAAGMWLLLFVLSSRGAVLSLLIAWVVIFLFFKLGDKRLFDKHVQSFLVGGAGAVAIIGGARLVTGEGQNLIRSGLSGRKEIWAEVLRLWSEAPFFGVGPMNFAHYSKLPFGHPHNAFLQIGMEFGVITLLILCFLFFLVLKAWLKAREHAPSNSTTGNVQATLVVTVLAAGIYSNVSGVIVMPLSQLMMAVVFGLLLGEGFLMRPLSKATESRVKACSIQAMKIFLALVGIAYVLLALYNLNDRVLWGAPDLRWSPRFWFEGRF